MRVFTAITLPILLAACATQKVDTAAYDQFGTGIQPGANAVEASVAVANPTDYSGKPVRLTGQITGVCQTKGCWMTIGTGTTPVFVKFKDYAFFVPKDATGRTAVIEGTLTMKQETVEETKHYLEDAGKKEEAAKVTEGRRLFHFMASGVAIEKTAK